MKYGWRMGGLWRTGLQKTPPTLEEFQALLVEIGQEQEMPQLWGVGLPGAVNHISEEWVSPAVFSLKYSVSRKGVNDIFAPLGMGPPSLVTNDLTANAYGITEGGRGVVVQMSTGLGARALGKEGVLPDPRSPEFMLLFDLRYELYCLKGVERSFFDWLAWSQIQSWLPSELQGLSWRHLAERPNEQVRQIARVFVAYCQRALEFSPEQDNLWAVGGGSLALKALIQEEAARASLPISFARDAETPGLQGLALMLDGGGA